MTIEGASGPAVVAAMTIDEKAALTAGADVWHTVAVPRLGIGTVRMTDGPSGARGQTDGRGESLSTSACIPSGSALGATWDPGTVRDAAAVVARQARQKGARILLAPTVNLQRHPLWGRNFEAFSEDPYLTGRLATAYVQGVQAEGVAATVKHLVCNESEHERRSCSSEVGERPLRELYLLPFEMVVREGGAQAVMTSYNRVNGRYVADDGRILSEILRAEWGFDGLVMTDWWALCGTVEAGEAGLDIEMPGPGRSFGPALAEAVRAGLVDEAALDAKVERLLRVFGRLDALKEHASPSDFPPEAAEDSPADRAVCRRAAAEAIVLLKNEGPLLPLDPGGLRRVALVGPYVAGPTIVGGGSARVRPHYSLDLRAAWAQRLGGGVTVDDAPGCTPDGPCSDDLLATAEELSRSADIAVVVVGTDAREESEGYDREGMDLPGRQAELVERVLEANPRTVVVLNTGAPVSLPFAERAPAILQCWFGGQELVNALVDVLVGDAEPGGRLPVTLPARIEDTPAFGLFPAESSTVLYGEGLLLGYRWYHARHTSPLFPFGHGLSYTTIAMTSARAQGAPLVPGRGVTVEVDLENTGPRPGSEVVQVYVAPPLGGRRATGGRLRELKALKAFAKVHLRPEEKTTVRLELNERAFAYYDVADGAWAALAERLGDEGRRRGGLHRSTSGWYVDSGIYELQIARSCDEICHRIPLRVEGREGPLPPDAPVG